MVIAVLARPTFAATVRALRAHVGAQEKAFKAVTSPKDIGSRARSLGCSPSAAATPSSRDARRPLLAHAARALTHGARRPSGAAATHAEHAGIVEAIAEGDAERARALLARHLQALRDQLDLSASGARQKTLGQTPLQR